MRIIIQDVKHLKIKQDLLWIGTTTLVTIILWVAYAIYTAFNQSSIDPAIKKLLEPLNPSLDQTALEVVKQRFVVPDDFTILVIDSSNSHNQISPQSQTGSHLNRSTQATPSATPPISPTPKNNLPN
jgi:hypothetical protein